MDIINIKPIPEFIKSFMNSFVAAKDLVQDFFNRFRKNNGVIDPSTGFRTSRNDKAMVFQYRLDNLQGFLFLTLFFCFPACLEAFDVLVLKSSDIKPYNDALEGFEETCNCNIAEFPYTDIDDTAIKAKIIKKRPDAVLAIGLDAFRHVRSITEIPVVYMMVPYKDTKNIRQKNISGVNMLISPEKQVEAIIEIFPKAVRIGIVYDPENIEASVQDVINSLETKGLELVTRKTGRPGEAHLLINDMKGKIDLLWMFPDTTIINQETFNNILQFSFLNNVPVFSFARVFVEKGATAALHIAPDDIGRQAGEIARTIVGKWPDPIRTTARKAVLTINNKVAAKLGIKIKKEILNKADHVY